jgi:hypothetical protein
VGPAVEGTGLGARLGGALGFSEGVCDGAAEVGSAVGAVVGTHVGVGVGSSAPKVGSRVGSTVGLEVVGVAVGSAVGDKLGSRDGGGVCRMLGCAVGLAVGLAVGATTASFSVKGVTTRTVPCWFAHPAMMVTWPDPAAGMVSVAAPLAYLLLPVQPPFLKLPFDVSNTYSPAVLDRLTVYFSPGRYEPPEDNVTEVPSCTILICLAVSEIACSSMIVVPAEIERLQWLLVM